MSIRIMIVEDNPLLTESIRAYLETKENMEVVATAQNAYAAMEQFERMQPQIVILDLVMPQADGFVLLEYLKNYAFVSKPQVIVLSAINNEAIIKRACDLGAVFYLVKPFSMAMLYERIALLTAGRQQEIEDDPSALVSIEKRIKSAFLSAGIPANLKGYYYLCEAVKMTVVEPQLIHQMTKKLYPMLGERFHTTASNIERAIRHLIQTAWSSDRLVRFNEILSTNTFSFAEKPTNTELIALLSQSLS